MLSSADEFFSKVLLLSAELLLLFNGMVTSLIVVERIDSCLEICMAELFYRPEVFNIFGLISILPLLFYIFFAPVIVRDEPEA